MGSLSMPDNLISSSRLRKDSSTSTTRVVLEELEPRCRSRSRHESLNTAGTKCESKNADSKEGDTSYVDDILFDDVMRVELFGDDVTSDFTSNSASHFSSSSLNREKASWMSD